jgi:Na+/proline symporter
MLLGLAGYLGLMLLIGAWVSRRIHNDEDYLVAGRQLGPVLLACSVYATWFGAETILGAAATIYTDGLAGGSADPFGYGLALVGCGALFAVPLWKRGFTTYADLFRVRYGVGVERLMIVIAVPSSIIWGAAQIRAFGQVVGAASGLDLTTAILGAAIFVLAYTMLGGLMADAITDVVQGLALAIGLVLIYIVVMREAGGFEASLALVDAERFAPFGSGGRSALEVLEEWAVPVCGSMLTAEIVQRILGARSVSVARWGTLGGAGLYVLVGLIPVYLGLVGPTLAPGLDDPEQLVPTLARQYLGPVVGVLFAGALVSIILSTVDSTLLAAGGFISHNVLSPLFPGWTSRDRLHAARAAVFVLGVVATILALGADSIYGLVLTASAFGGAGVFVVSCFAVFTSRGGSASAYAGLVVGLVVWAWGEYAAGWTAPFVTAVVASTVAYVALAFGTRAGDTSMKVA